MQNKRKFKHLWAKKARFFRKILRMFCTYRPNAPQVRTRPAGAAHGTAPEAIPKTEATLPKRGRAFRSIKPTISRE